MAKFYVDQNESDNTDQWAYTNQDGDEESVRLVGKSVIDIKVGNDIVTIYIKDIPNLILALQAAHDSVENE